MKKKKYVIPQMEEMYVDELELLADSGVTGEEPYDDIGYGGEDDGSRDPE